MIITLMLTNLLSFFTYMFGFLPSLPGLPFVILTTWEEYIFLVYEGFGLLSNWVNLDLAFVVLAINIAVHNFTFIYALIAWFVDKIPFVNVKLN